MVAVHWPRWPPRPYMVKTFKNLLQNRECLWAEPLQESLGTGGLPKLLKELSYVDVWPFYGKVKFASLCICMEKTFKNLPLQNRACLMAESLHISSGTEELPKLLKYWSYIDIWPFYGKVNFASLCICMGKMFRISNNFSSKMVAVRWPRWLPRPYMVKTFKNLLLQNRECLGAEPLQESSGTWGLPTLLKELSYVDVWPFYGKVKFASLCICMEKTLKIFFSKTEHALWLNLCIYLREQEGYQNC